QPAIRDQVRLKPDTTEGSARDSVLTRPHPIDVTTRAAEVSARDLVPTRPHTTDVTTQAGSINVPVVSGFNRTAIRGEIEFRDLTFAYGDRVVLDHISVRISAGQKVAIVGPTGSGKSTLVSLLARLHDPPSGAVFLDGVDIRDLPLAVLRGAIGFVP